MNEFWWFVFGFLSGVVAGVFGLFALGRSIQRPSEEKQQVETAKNILDEPIKKKNRTMWG